MPASALSRTHRQLQYTELTVRGKALEIADEIERRSDPRCLQGRKLSTPSSRKAGVSAGEGPKSLRADVPDDVLVTLDKDDLGDPVDKELSDLDFTVIILSWTASFVVLDVSHFIEQSLTHRFCTAPDDAPQPIPEKLTMQAIC